ncbi:hypothetical protein YC2023_116926 [Brassica napus]
MTGTRLSDECAQAVRSLGSLLNYVRLNPRKGIRSTIERYKKASDNTNTHSVQEINAAYYQQESAKLRQQIQTIQNSNRHLMGDSLSALSVKELKQVENRLEKAISRIRSKNEIELDNESVYLRTKQKWRGFNSTTIKMVSGTEMTAIEVLASRNYFAHSIMTTGSGSGAGHGCSYSDPDKKIHLG